MTEINWVEPGASLSHKNACKEYGLSEEEIIAAIKTRKIQFKVNYAHGNPYYKLLRAEVEMLAQSLHGIESVENIRSITGSVRLTEK